MNTNTKTRREITKQEEYILKDYLNKLDILILEEICPKPVAHTIDVILKEAIRTWEEDDLSIGTDDKGNFTGNFETDYELFDSELVFFGKGYTSLWMFPITIYKNQNNCIETNWTNHNWFYPDNRIYLDENNLICNFYQDIDIFGTEETWKWDLVKALFMVIYAVYNYWESMNDNKIV